MPKYVAVDREPKARKPREPKQVPIDGKLRDALDKLREDFPGRSLKQLLVAAGDNGIDVTRAQMSEYLRVAPAEKAKEVLHQAMPFRGKAAAEGPQDRMLADLAIYNKASEGQIGFLMVADTFTREVWARAIANKSAPTVLAAWKEIQKDIWGDDKPENTILTTDRGLEFTGAFRRYLQEQGIIWKVRPVANKNDLAVLDTAMGRIRAALKAEMITNKVRAWPRYLQKVIKAHNATYNQTMHGAPKDTVRNPMQHFLTIQDNARNFLHNHKNEERLQQQLARGFGRFRPPVIPKGGLAFQNRATIKRFGPTREAEYVRPGVVVDTRGTEHTLKLVLPVGNREGPRRRY